MALRRKRSARDRGRSPFLVGAIALGLTVVLVFFAFSRANPFADPYEFTAVFRSAENLKADAVVRIAGVNVGKVTKVESLGDGQAARVTMQISEDGLPIKRDATAKIRPRIFLEGNLFVDLSPGSPSAPELPDGGGIPVQQTATPVLFSDVLAALQSDTRSDLQTFLKEYAKGLEGEGAEGIAELYREGEGAYRESAIANEATLGTEEHDLSRLISGQQRAFARLARNPETLRNLVTDFNTFAAALAREDRALEASIPALDRVLRNGSPALAALNGSLPSLRAFARDALPATRSSIPAIQANLPFIRQARRLVGESELKGLVEDLRATVPDLVELDEAQVEFLEQARAVNQCASNTLIPWAKTPIPDPDFPDNSGQPFYKQAWRGFVGLAGESRIYDANSPMFHFNFGSGPYTIVQPAEDGSRTVGTTAFPPIGVRPARPERRPQFRPDVPCETQEPPDLNAVGGQASATVVKPRYKPSEADKELSERARKAHGELVQHLKDKKAGRPTIDDYLEYTPDYLPEAARRQGLRMLPGGRFEPIEDLAKKGGER